VLSTAGSTVHRLREDALVVAARSTDPGPGIANLYLAGDWTLNGINGGCVEAATMSGMRASRSICGTPADISSENVDWLTRVEQ
jgi:predicted NAD/FAD-dependent oxidoreductase